MATARTGDSSDGDSSDGVFWFASPFLSPQALSSFPRRRESSEALFGFEQKMSPKNITLRLGPRIRGEDGHRPSNANSQTGNGLDELNNNANDDTPEVWRHRLQISVIYTYQRHRRLVAVERLRLQTSVVQFQSQT